MEDIIPEVEEFYRKIHNGRKLQWFHHMPNGTVRTLLKLFSIYVNQLLESMTLADI